MTDGAEGLDEAQRMLEAFASVGAKSIDLTWTNAAGDPRRPRTLKRALQSLGGKLPEPKSHWLNSVYIESIGSEISRARCRRCLAPQTPNGSI